MTRLLFLASALLVLGTPAVRATLLGLDVDPMGAAWNRGDANSGFAIWDTFPGTQFSNLAPNAAGTATGGITNPLSHQASEFTVLNQGAGLYSVVASTPGSDVLFAGGNAVDFSVSGQVDFTIRGVTLQIKRSLNAAGFTANPSSFSPTLSINGGAPIAFDSVFTVSGNGDTSSTNGLWSVTTWVWGPSLSLAPTSPSSTFTLSFPSNGTLQRAVDGFAVDLGAVAPQAVPEPATLGLLGLALAAAGVSRRRRASGKERE